MFFSVEGLVGALAYLKDMVLLSIENTAVDLPRNSCGVRVKPLCKEMADAIALIEAPALSTGK